MSTWAAELTRELDARIADHAREYGAFRAIVTGIAASGMVTVRRLTAIAAETEEYARLAGFTLSIADEVLCLNLNGVPVVLGLLQRSSLASLSLPSSLVVDTNLTVDGDVFLGNGQNDLITIGGHLKFVGSAPSLTLGAALGSTGTAAFEFGNDTRGVIRFTPGGTGIGSGVIVTLGWFIARDDANYTVSLFAENNNAAPLNLHVTQAAQSTTGCSLRTTTTLVSGTEYWIGYKVFD